MKAFIQSQHFLKEKHYLRIEQIIHRDIRLENIIMDSDKYFNIIDFTYSINFNDKNNPKYYLKNDEKYIAPEVSKRKEYNYTADYYALGSIIYYLIFKNFPNVIKKKRKLIHLAIDYTNIHNYSYNCIDLINKLIVTDPTKRIGYKDINEIKNHPWFKGFKWRDLENKKIISPFKFIPNSNNNPHCSKPYKDEKMINSFKNLFNPFSQKK